jgi:hypothetical protein
MTDPTSCQRERPHRQDCNFLKIKINKQNAGHMPQMGYDTKTDGLTDRQSQCDFDFDSRYQLQVATTRCYIYETTARVRSSDRRPASAVPTRASPTGADLRGAAVAADTTHRQPSADQLGQLPARCLQNPACCVSGNL